ncbi:ribonuclease G [candidate division LCP-89 bacterium B3_LCP]|uniref:Ribonuclease G n=1 Tax=candidate division LCP-89 bacterium B3_LCP TaxID=2012998 RepID=A0A532URQ1_UNCL8|nr:MAG: ribonuclease G [candidate division LCP-89 bacterium B3_LCP]
MKATKEIIINSTPSETRIAMLEDGELAELFVERPQHERTLGNIYKGIVRKVVPGMQAAFINYGEETDAFLHFSDVAEVGSTGGLSPIPIVEMIVVNEKGEKHTIRSPLKNNQEIIIQVIKEPIGSKGPRASSQISLAGRYLVLIPGQNDSGISRRIINIEERKRLRKLVRSIRPKNFGLIVRTVAEGHDENELRGDLQSLMDHWKDLETKIHSETAPSLIYQDLSMAFSIVRDLFTPDISVLAVDSRKLYRDVHSYLKEVSPQILDTLSLYRGRTPIFDHYKIEQRIESIISRKVPLDGGGHIVIDLTEAMVSIDVNSGRYIGKKDHEENSLKINLRAAREIARQLRLRDIGGLIAVDFIDLIEEKNRRKVYDEIKKKLRSDRAKTDVLPISYFGILEMTRQRLRPALLYTFNEPCSSCRGTGMVPSLETIITRMERWISRFRHGTREPRLLLTVHPDLAAALRTDLKPRFRQMMLKHLVHIKLKEDPTLRADEFQGYSYRQKRDITAQYDI